jgi:peroxiredoxin
METREAQQWEPLLIFLTLILFLSFIVFPAREIHKDKDADVGSLPSGPINRFLDDDGFSAGTLRKGDTAPDFEVEYLEGGTIRLSELARKHRLVVLNFFATWCGPCREELPELSALGTDMSPKGVLVLSVSPERAQKISDFAGDRFPGVLLARDRGGMGQSSFGVGGIPATFVLSPDLKILAAHSGYSPAKMQDLRRKIDALLESDEDSTSAVPPSQARERRETVT